jgi:hypothetical protein
VHIVRQTGTGRSALGTWPAPRRLLAAAGLALCLTGIAGSGHSFTAPDRNVIGTHTLRRVGSDGLPLTVVAGRLLDLSRRPVLLSVEVTSGSVALSVERYSLELGVRTSANGRTMETTLRDEGTFSRKGDALTFESLLRHNSWDNPIRVLKGTLTNGVLTLRLDLTGLGAPPGFISPAFVYER